MSRRENPLENETFKKIYVAAFEKEKSGYELSMEIYGYDKKASYILDIIRANPQYFHKKTIKDKPHPKYLSNSTKLVEYIFRYKEKPSTNMKHQIKQALDCKEFRSACTPKFNIYTFEHIITLIGVIAASALIFKNHSFKWYGELVDEGFTDEEIKVLQRRIYRGIDTTFKPSFPEDTTSKDIFDHSTEIAVKLVSLSDEVLWVLIQASPLSMMLPMAVFGTLQANDMIWEERMKKKKQML